MAKRLLNIDNEMARVSVRRDAVLHGVSLPLSANRLQRLEAVVAKAYPVHAALKAIVAERDRSLESEKGIPTSVTLALTSRLRFLRDSTCDAVTSEPLIRKPFCNRLLRNWTQLAAAAAIILLASLCLVKWIALTRQAGISKQSVAWPAKENSARWRVPDTMTALLSSASFTASDDYLSLQVNKLQLVAFQSSTFAVDRSAGSNTHDLNRILRLDLPILQIGLDADSVAVPQ